LLEREFFEDVPSVERLFRSAKKRLLYIPSRFNFADIDAAIVQCNSKTHEAHVYLIQVTISASHKDSKTSFYKNQWAKWQQKFKKEEYKVSSTFVWIDMQEPSQKQPSQKQPSQKKEPRKIEVHISIRLLDPRAVGDITAAQTRFQNKDV